ncbi:MAG: hypothetical protein RSF81_08505 [Oscillospiraceae bacterium]
MLNKKVGDYCCDWNHRQAYVRVYDPRNFEFEITIENLLYILENANSIKGKGLEGEFVYGWDGKVLLLIPTISPDYQGLKEYTSIVFNNNFIKAKDLIIGATYRNKSNKELIYLGKFDEYDWYGANKGKRFFFAERRDTNEFYYKDCKYSFETFSSMSQKLINCVHSSCAEDYAEIFDILEHKTIYSPIDNNKDEFINYTYDEFLQRVNTTTGELYFYASPEKDGLRNTYEVPKISDGLLKPKVYIPYGYTYYNSPQTQFKETRFETKRIQSQSNWGYGNWYDEVIPVTVEELFNTLQPAYKNIYLANGKFYERNN